MSSLTVWKFDTASAAQDVRDSIVAMQRRQLIQVHDAVVVAWPKGAKRPETNQNFSPTGSGAVGGAFWGVLIGIIFMVPLFGAAFGAALGAAAGSLRDFGIDDDFVRQVRENVTPGTSALFLLSSHADREQIRAELGGRGAELISTNLNVEDQEELRAMFAS